MRLGGQGLFRPTGVSAGFGVADVDRPVSRKWKFFKHSAEGPSGTRLIPEGGVRDGMTFLPLPIFRGPQLGVPVAAVFDEAEKLRVGDHIFVDAKVWNDGCEGTKFIIPTEWGGRASRKAESRLAGVHVDHFVFYWAR